VLHLNNIIPTPGVLIMIFPSDKEFKEWAEDLVVYDLDYWLERFEEEEFYEHCAILRDLIKEHEASSEIVRLYKGYL